MRRDDRLRQEEMLDTIQRQAFGYFIHEVNPVNGLVLDKTAPDWPCSIAAVGMALTVYPIGVERGLMTHADAAKRTLTTLRFFHESEQSDSPIATGYRGFYYHFINMKTGKRAFDCELSSIDTALLMAGIVCAASFFTADNPYEIEIRSLATSLYERVDWQWMLAGEQTVCHGWKPETGFLPFHWKGYDEALILYVLALGSPTHPIAAESYKAWTQTYDWRTVEGIESLHASSLFIHQMSHVWIDFRGLQDDFMREHNSDYFHNSSQATRIQQRYAIRNPGRFEDYGELSWGISASDGPGRRNPQPAGSPRTYFDYIARGVPDGPDDGTLAPWAVVASLPFAPDIVIPALENFMRLQLHLDNPYGFKASFNATYPSSNNHPAGWVSPFHFGIDVGPIVIMVDNHRSGFIWRLCRNNPVIKRGLKIAGFRGGWLENSQ